MLEFTKSLKLYYFFDRREASLSIRSSSRHVLTFYMSAEMFEKIVGGYDQKDGVNVGPYYVQRKAKYLRFSFSHGNGLQENLRLTNSQWDEMVAAFRAQKTNSENPYLTIEVD